MLSKLPGPIGVFDSGYGGLTILNEIRKILPQYDYIYLGDNARAPYGPRSFQVVYNFTKQAVTKLFEFGCHLVILGCNTASAKALRSIQQHDLIKLDPNRRVLGIIRPTAESIEKITHTRHIGILATEGTIKSKSYKLEINKLFPDIVVNGVACPLWAAIVEAGEANTKGADFFVEKRINMLMKVDPKIDAIILGCTHYPLLADSIKKFVPQNVRIIAQGQYVANSLKDYLIRHEEINNKCTQNATCRYFTTEETDKFKENAPIFLHRQVDVEHTILE